MSDNTDPIWQQYANAVLDKATKELRNTGHDISGTRYHFSVCGSMLSTDVADPDPKQANTAIFFLGNNIPSLQGAYIPSSTLFTSYYLLLNYTLFNLSRPYLSEHNLSFSEPLITRMLNEYSKKAHLFFSTFHNETGVPDIPQAGLLKDILETKAFKEVMSMVSALLSSDNIKNASDEQAIAALTDNLSKLKAASNSQASNEYNMPVTFSEDTVAAFAPCYSLPGIKARYAQWQSDAAGEQTITFNLYESNALTASRSHGLPDGSFCTHLCPPVNNMAENISDPKGEWFMSVEFKGFGTFAIEQGGWFDMKNIELCKTRPPSEGPVFFGEKGSMSLLPAFAVIGYQPKMKITAKSSGKYDSLLKRLFTPHSPPDKIGPFALGKNLSADPSKKNSDLTVIYDSGSTRVPGLLGVISLKL